MDCFCLFQCHLTLQPSKSIFLKNMFGFLSPYSLHSDYGGGPDSFESDTRFDFDHLFNQRLHFILRKWVWSEQDYITPSDFQTRLIQAITREGNCRFSYLFRSIRRALPHDPNSLPKQCLRLFPPRLLQPWSKLSGFMNMVAQRSVSPSLPLSICLKSRLPSFVEPIWSNPNSVLLFPFSHFAVWWLRKWRKMAISWGFWISNRSPYLILARCVLTLRIHSP